MATKTSPRLYAFGLTTDCPHRFAICIPPLDLSTTGTLAGAGRYGEPLPIAGTIREADPDAVAKAVQRIKRTFIIPHRTYVNSFELIEADACPPGGLPLSRFAWVEEYGGDPSKYDPAKGNIQTRLEEVKS